MNFDKNIFLKLLNLKTLRSSDYKFCCIKSCTVTMCLPKADVFSSCTDLMANEILRFLLWVMGALSLLGNAIVIGVRIRSKGQNKVQSYLISNLAGTDMLMGVYLLTIAGADITYRGRYIEVDNEWRLSSTCNFAGIGATTSSLASLMILLLITFNIFRAIVLPYNSFRLKMKFAITTTVAIWLLAFILALIPTVYFPYFKGEYYGRSTVCLPLHITSEKHRGWMYSFLSLTIIPAVATIFLLISYGWMFLTISKSTTSAGVAQSRNVRTFRQMFVIVLTDLCCWLPVCILGELSRSII